LDLCRSGRFDEAARFLDLRDVDPRQGPRLARQLKAILDRYAWSTVVTHPEQVSPLPSGNPGDGLSPGVDEVARVPVVAGGSEPVRMARRTADGAARWVFSRATVGRVEPWFQRLSHQWAFRVLPERLLRAGPRELLWWQWIALLPLVLLCSIAGRLLCRWTQRVGRTITSRTRANWDDGLFFRLKGPMSLAWTLVLLSLGIHWLDPYKPALELLQRLLRVGTVVASFWALTRTVETTREILARSAWARSHPASRSLLPLFARVSKFVVLALGAVTLLAAMGYSVSSVLAGLGIGGIALALAAQKTVEHLFGAFSIGVDEPFREGDTVRVEDVTGTVEAIGLRSTRIRTPDRTVVAIPNGKLAEMKIESLTARDRIRLDALITLTPSTTATQMAAVLTGFEATLRAQPLVWTEELIVRFKEIGPAGLVVEVVAWFRTPEWNDFRAIRQTVLLGFLKVVQDAGSALAFPAYTVRSAAGA
jgi:MscS family membrane protein